MKHPLLTVALAKKGEEPSLLITRNDNELLNQINLELKFLNSLGKLGAQAMIGEYVLMMLHQAHPNDFTPFEALVPEDTQMHHPRDTVEYLIRSTQLQKTNKFIPIIDSLMVAFAEELSGTDLPLHWPTFKEAFQRLYPN